MPMGKPVETDPITAKFALEVCEDQIKRAERRIAEYTAQITAEPKDAVGLSTSIARYGFERHIWDMGAQVALGNRTLKSLEASLSSRLLSLCGQGEGTISRVLTDKIEMACIEDALDSSGVIGVLRRIEGIESTDTPPTLAALVQAYINTPEKLKAVAEQAYPNLSTLEDREDRQTDVLNVLEAFRDLVKGQ